MAYQVIDIPLYILQLVQGVDKAFNIYQYQLKFQNSADKVKDIPRISRLFVHSKLSIDININQCSKIQQIKHKICLDYQSYFSTRNCISPAKVCSCLLGP